MLPVKNLLLSGGKTYIGFIHHLSFLGLSPLTNKQQHAVCELDSTHKLHKRHKLHKGKTHMITDASYGGEDQKQTLAPAEESHPPDGKRTPTIAKEERDQSRFAASIVALLPRLDVKLTSLSIQNPKPYTTRQSPSLAISHRHWTYLGSFFMIGSRLIKYGRARGRDGQGWQKHVCRPAACVHAIVNAGDLGSQWLCNATERPPGIAQEGVRRWSSSMHGVSIFYLLVQIECEIKLTILISCASWVLACIKDLEIL